VTAHHLRQAILALLVALLLPATAFALGHSGANAQSTATATATATRTPKATPTPYADAVAVRDQLLAVAKSSTRTTNADDAFGVYPAWLAAFPGLDVSGSGLAAHDSVVSAYLNLLNSKQSPSASNPEVLAFAVTDASGKCAFGVISGYPAYSSFEPIAVPAGARCRGDSAVDAFAASLAAATPSATAVSINVPRLATQAAPAPPATGSGAATGTLAVRLPLLALAAALVVIGAAAATLSRRR
jgi:hypothetical protein